jgi:hypothetical protein
MLRTALALFALSLVAIPALNAADSPAIGDFEAQADVGKVDPPGTATFDKTAGQYKISSSGQNIWAEHDDFHFVYRKHSGDLAMTADISFVGEGKNAHRKAACMVRQSLDADSPYADVVVHGDGSIALQYRAEKGGVTKSVKSKTAAPATLRIERKGHEFTASVASKGGAFEPIESVKLELKDPVYAGLAVSAHDATVTETAIFSKVTIK